MGSLLKLKTTLPINTGHIKSLTTVAESISTYFPIFLTKGKEYFEEDAKYLNHIAETLFNLLPIPIQLLGKEQLKWNTLLLEVRNATIVIMPDRVALQKNFSNIIINIVKTHLSHHEQKEEKPLNNVIRINFR
jgi:hypothetical protein